MARQRIPVVLSAVRKHLRASGFKVKLWAAVTDNCDDLPYLEIGTVYPHGACVKVVGGVLEVKTYKYTLQNTTDGFHVSPPMAVWSDIDLADPASLDRLVKHIRRAERAGERVLARGASLR